MTIIIRSLVMSLCLLTVSAYGQKIEVTHRKDKPDKGIEPEEFHYIDTGYIMHNDLYIATFEGYVLNSGKSILPNLFNSFWEKANELGANSFRIENVNKGDDTISVSVSVYNLSDSIVQEMIELYPTNMLYVIGDVDKNQKTKRIRLNKEKVELAPMEYIAYKNNIGEKATLSIGGFLGAKVWIKGQKDKLPQHFSLSGFGVGPGFNRGVGVSFNTGRIYPVNLNFGQFLVTILKEKN